MKLCIKVIFAVLLQMRIVIETRKSYMYLTTPCTILYGIPKKFLNPCPGRCDLKILQSNSPRAFIPIPQQSQESHFSIYGICSGIEQILQNFIKKQIQKKITTEFSINLKKKPIFSPFWAISGAKEIFQKIQLLHTTSYGFLTQFPKLEKTNDSISRKHLNRQTDGEMEGQIHNSYLTESLQLLTEYLPLSYIILTDCLPV